MEIAKVCEVFALIAGISMDEALAYVAIVRLAMSEVRGKLREGISEEEQKELLTYVCAATAYYRYACIESAKERAATIRTGEVSISNDPKAAIAAAKSVRDEF